ncbi:MAG: four helix bundle protein [Desulfamplus sp.]
MAGGVKDFEELEIFKKARVLVNEIYILTKNEQFKKDYELADQIRRAGISIMSNIAEGFDRGNNEFKRYLSISRGSVSEVRSQAIIARDLGYIGETDYLKIKKECNELSAMIKSLINYLKSKGEKEHEKI